MRICAQRPTMPRRAHSAPRCGWCAAISPARAPTARDCWQRWRRPGHRAGLPRRRLRPAPAGSHRRRHCSRPIRAPPAHDAAHSRLLAHRARRAAASAPTSSIAPSPTTARRSRLQPRERFDPRRAGRCAGGARRAARGARTAGRRTAGSRAAGAARRLCARCASATRCARRPRRGSRSRRRAAMRSIIAKRRCWRWMAVMPRGRCGGAGKFRAAEGTRRRARAGARRRGGAATPAPASNSRDWLRSTGYRDAVTENILAGAAARLEWRP